MSHAIALVHLGEELPPHLPDTLYQIRLFNECPVFMLAERAALAASPLDDALGVEAIAVEELPISPAHTAFRQSAQVDKGFRFGFWTYVIERFFYLSSFASQYEVENLFHLETDVLLYVDLSELLAVFRQHYEGMAVPFSGDLIAIAGFMYFKDQQILEKLSFFLANVFVNNPGLQANDMQLLGLLRQNFGPVILDSLPVVPADDPGPLCSLWTGPSANPELYTRHFDQFRGVFDAAALGQFLDGIDPRNNAGRQTMGFLNEQACYWAHRYRYMLVTDGQGRRVPHLLTKTNRWPIFNLHLHSKNLAGFLSRPRPRPAARRLAGRRPPGLTAIDEPEVISSERLQALADISVIDDGTRAFHTGLHQSHQVPLCHLPGTRNHLIVDGPGRIRDLQKASVIFVYTHLLDSFINHVLPHLSQRFVLITHSSDDAIGERHRPFLDDVRLLHWFAQNVTIRHPKLTPLPIGQANRQWPHGDTRVLIEVASENRPKTRDLYLNLDTRTNPGHRKPIFDLFADKPFVTRGTPLPYRDYLRELAEHRFCVSPHGNGIDTHRTWEALYLGVIPIVPAGPWMEGFEDLPILPVSRWDRITPEFLAREEQRIRWEHCSQEKLTVSYWRERIRCIVEPLGRGPVGV